MIWVAWRQHRLVVGGFAAIFLGVVAIYLLAGPLQADAKAVYQAASGFSRLVKLGEDLSGFLLLPLLVGVFAGAPLVSRELERGTFRFAWTQGVSRGHWAGVNVLLVGGAVLLLSVAHSAAHMWWFRPIAPEEGWFRIFNQSVLVFPASCLLTFVMGVAAGVLFKRTIPAMAATLIGSIAVFIGVRMLRPHYLPPVTSTETYPDVQVAYSHDELRDAFFLSSGGELGPGMSFIRTVTYHPADRFWTFQFIETGIYVAITAGLLALAFWGLRRNLT